jgi:PAS domain-containing protein
LLHGPDYRFELANPAYQQLVGRAVIGRTVREAFPEVEGQGFLALLDDVFSTGRPFIGRDIEIVFQPPHGGAPETRVLDFVYQPIKDKAGNVTSIFVEGSDQTERRATENALRQSEARLRALNLDLERQVIQRTQARSLTWQLSPDLLGAP